MLRSSSTSSVQYTVADVVAMPVLPKGVKCESHAVTVVCVLLLSYYDVSTVDSMQVTTDAGGTSTKCYDHVGAFHITSTAASSITNHGQSTMRVDEVSWCDNGLSHHAAHSLALAVAARACALGALEPPTGSNGAVLCTTTLSGVATMEGTVRECAAADAVDCSNAAGCTKAFAPASLLHAPAAHDKPTSTDSSLVMTTARGMLL
eukprot:18087-Heterococcus_DN1.PRE.1